MGLKTLQHPLTRGFLRSDWPLVSRRAAAWPVPFSGRSLPESKAYGYKNSTFHKGLRAKTMAQSELDGMKNFWGSKSGLHSNIENSQSFTFFVSGRLYPK